MTVDTSWRPSLYRSASQLRTLRRLAMVRDGKPWHADDYRKSSVLSNLDHDFTGVLGEDLSSEWTGIRWDRNGYVVGDDGLDLLRSDGLRIAVKYNHRPFGNLFIKVMPGDDGRTNIHKIRKSDVILLVHGNCLEGQCVCHRTDIAARYRVSGFVTVERFLRECRRVNHGHEDKWMFPYRDMTPAWSPFDIAA